MLKILTERNYNTSISHQVVYEWEEDFAAYFKTSLFFLDSYKKHPVSRLFRKIGIVPTIRWKEGREVYIYLVMNVNLLRLTAAYLPNTIPVLFDVTVEDIDILEKLVKNLPFYYVTSLGICERIRKKYPESKVQYMPQSVSVRHVCLEQNRDIDLIQFGRRNPVLHEYALEYCNKHKGVSYLFRHMDADQGMIWYCDGQARDIGVIGTREDFMAYLKRSRISLCSSPCMDHTRDFGDNIDFLTARWYESAASGCHILARWSEFVEPEIERTSMESFADNIISYEQFEKLADEYLNAGCCDGDRIERFIESNSTSARAKTMENQLKINGIVE